MVPLHGLKQMGTSYRFYITMHRGNAPCSSCPPSSPRRTSSLASYEYRLLKINMADHNAGLIQGDNLRLDPLQFLNVPAAGPRQER